MRIQVLGPVRAWRDNRPVDLGPAGRRAVLGLLALADGRPLSRGELIDALWGDRPPASAVNILQTQVKHLRRALEPERRRYGASGCLPTVGDGYALQPPAEVDLTRFRQLADAATAHERGDHPARAAAVLDEAVRLWRGAPLADVPQLAAHPKVVALRAARLAVLTRLGTALIGADEVERALPILAEVADEQPLDEAAQARLIDAYRAAGLRARAFETYHRVRRRLVDELGVDPGSRLRAAHAALLHLDDPHDAAAEPAGPATEREGDDAAPGRTAPAAEPVRPPAQLPPDVIGFAGRAVELRRLDRLLPDDPRTPPPAAVVATLRGTAGVGKTTLAVHWAHRVADRFPDGQLYLNLRGYDPVATPMEQAESVRSLLDALGVTAQRIPVSLSAQVGLYRGLLAPRRMLILLDNARDAEQVRPLLPPAPGCLVLVTSRNRLTGLVVTAGAVPVTVDLPSAGEAWRMLAERIGAHRLAAEPEATDEIVTRCARLPLALAVVAARAAGRPGLPLAALAAELREARDDTGGGGFEPFDVGDAATDVRAVLSWSYRALSAPAARLFRLIGAHPGGELNRYAAASLAGVPGPLARRLLGELSEAHLVTEPAPGRFTAHDLLRRYAADLADEVDGPDGRRAATHRALDHYIITGYAAASLLYDLEITPPATPDPGRPPDGVLPEPLSTHADALSWLTTERPVLLAAARAGSDRHTDLLARTLAEFLDRQGHWQALADIETTALAAARRLGDRAGQAHAHRAIARARARMDQNEDSTWHLHRALELYTELGDGVGQARTRMGLSWVSGAERRYAEALHHAEAALRSFTVAGHASGQANALNTVGWFHAQLGDHRASVQYCRRALELHRELDDRPGQADTWDSLGLAYHRLGRFPDAIDCYRRAVRLYRELTARYNEADTLGRLGDTYHAAGEPAAAGEAWRLALPILRELGHQAADGIRQRLDALHAGNVAHAGDAPDHLSVPARVSGGGYPASPAPAARTSPPGGR